MSRNVQVVILCEDRQHAAFARRFLEMNGQSARIQRVLIAPKGRGSGEQFVRENFTTELAFYRSRKHRVQQALIVIVDADTISFNERIIQLENACDVAGVDRRQPDERVAVFIPGRNIETWCAYLSGTTVDEDTTYPRLERERDCAPLVERLAEMCRQRMLRQPSPPSLDAACTEFRARLEQV